MFSDLPMPMRSVTLPSSFTSATGAHFHQADKLECLNFNAVYTDFLNALPKELEAGLPLTDYHHNLSA